MLTKRQVWMINRSRLHDKCHSEPKPYNHDVVQANAPYAVQKCSTCGAFCYGYNPCRCKGKGHVSGIL